MNNLHIKNIIVLILLALGIFNTAYAAIIDGPANIRLAPNGKIIASINDKVHVNCYRKKEDWYVIRVPVKLNMKDINDDIIITGTELYNLTGDFIGEAITEIKLMWPYTYIDGVSGMVSAYTYKDNVMNIGYGDRCN